MLLPANIATVAAILFLFTSSAHALADSTFRRVNLGGVEQTILIRGDDRAKPILLFLHGGPGVSEMPLAYRNQALEQDFTVVHWDQRGTGKSFRRNTPNMTIEQFVRDTIELTQFLEREFGQKKIILVGHSWGTLIGALAVARAPNLYRAYIGISQLVNIPRSEEELDTRARATAREQGDRRKLRDLERLGPFPYPNHKVEREVNKLQKQIMGEVANEFSAARFIATAIASPDYSLCDDVKLLGGVVFSGKALEREIYAADLARSAPELKVPVWFLGGRRDTVLSQPVACDYYKRLIAPRGKHFVWFEQSNHWPQIEEAEKYRKALHEIRIALDASERRAE